MRSPHLLLDTAMVEFRSPREEAPQSPLAEASGQLKVAGSGTAPRRA